MMSRSCAWWKEQGKVLVFTLKTPCEAALSSRTDSIVRLSLRLPACDSRLSFGTRCPRRTATHLTPPAFLSEVFASQAFPLPRAHILVLSRPARAVRNEVVTLSSFPSVVWGAPPLKTPALLLGTAFFLAACSHHHPFISPFLPT